MLSPTIKLTLALLLSLYLGLGAGPGQAGRGHPAPTPPVRAKYRDLASYTLDSLRYVLTKPSLADSSRFFILLQLANYYYERGDKGNALRYGRQALAHARRVNDIPGTAHGLYNLALFSAAFGDQEATLDYAQQGAAVAEAHQLSSIWDFYLLLGLAATNTNDANGAVRYLRRAYEEQRKLPPGRVSPGQAGEVRLSMARAFLVAQQADSVLRYVRLARPYYQQTARAGDLRGRAALHETTGLVYLWCRPRTATMLDSAARNLLRAFRLNGREQPSRGSVTTALQLAQALRLQGRSAVSRKAAEYGLTYARYFNMVDEQVAALRALAAARADQGQYREAAELAEQESTLRDSLFNRARARALAQLQVQFRVRRQQQQLALLTQQNRTAAVQRQAQRARLDALLIVLGVLGVGLLTGALLYWRLRRSRALLARANQEISKSVEEKEVLIQEVHHRVKNNLQLVSSLLAWQSSTLPDPALSQVLAGSQARIQSMALVHEFLYRSDNLAQVRLDRYLGELLTSLHESLTSPQKPIDLSTDLAPVTMDAREASALGLIVNELVTNAYKHAFNQQPHGHLHVSLTHDNDAAGFHLRVLDDGVGLPPTSPATSPPARPAGIGMQLVSTLVRQLRATLTTSLRLPRGTCVEVARA